MNHIWINKVEFEDGGDKRKERKGLWSRIKKGVKNTWREYIIARMDGEFIDSQHLQILYRIEEDGHNGNHESFELKHKSIL